MATAVVLEEQVEIPFVGSLDEFRAWAASDDFPERGRIDYVSGRIEVDMSPEDFFYHGTPKTELVSSLGQLIKRKELGYLLSDRTRVSCPAADLSVEPDLVFISADALDSGRVRLVPKSTAEPDRFIEVEGAPDVVVEIVSDSSERKDTQRLPWSYWRAGVREFWLVDARGPELVFVIQRRGRSGWRKVPGDREGFQQSAVFGRRFRFTRYRDRRGGWAYDLEVQ
jgi:Uma2 family endonuclease